jgi:membrane protein implicated in regulation of membrane protease activity
VWPRAILGTVLCAVGVLWIGQGIGIIGGSFMSGRFQWALYGGVALVIGLALLSLARRSRRNGAEPGS